LIEIAARAPLHREFGRYWVVHFEPVGSGQAAFKYLAPYIFRVALSNNRILSLNDGLVTFQYKDSATDQVKTSTATAEEFIRRFLQHVLPKHFVKVRLYGLLSPGNRHLLNKARKLLGAGHYVKPSSPIDSEQPRCCPACGSAFMLVRTLTTLRSRSP